MSTATQARSSSRSKTKTLSVTSGKGGVGKSTLVANLALKLSRSGKKVLIFDGDLGMANVDVMFGVRSRKTIEHVLSGECELSEIVLEIDKGLSLIPGGSGIDGLQNISVFQKKALLDQVSCFSINKNMHHRNGRALFVVHRLKNTIQI